MLMLLNITFGESVGLALPVAFILGRIVRSLAGTEIRGAVTVSKSHFAHLGSVRKPSRKGSHPVARRRKPK